MKFTDWMQHHRRSILFLIAILAAGGLAVSFNLPVALFPRIDFPRVVVGVDAGDRPADLMAIEVTRPIEETIRSVPGVRKVRSNTSRGSADISIDFDWGDDMVAAMLQVESAVNQVLPNLPSGVSFTVRRMDPTVFPVLAYSLTSDTHTLTDLRDIAQYQLLPLLSTVNGVARVEVQGGAVEEYEVVVDPGRIESMGLSIEDVANALSAANVISAVGRMEDHYKLYLIVSDTRLKNLSGIADTIIRSGANGLVRLENIATVKKGVAPQWTRVTADGHDAVVFQIYQQPGGNTVAIAKAVKAKLDGFKGSLPADVTIANWYDQSDLVVSAAGSVRDAVLIGLLFAAIVLWIFLRNMKMTFIAAVMVPSVLAATVLLLNVLHMSFNIMTLGGLAAAVGLIIDDMIVMEEQIVRGLAEMKDHRRGVVTAIRELTLPLSGSSASTIIIFAPLAFLSGVTGSFFKALSLTMASSLFISFFVAWLGVPLLAGRLLTRKDAEQEIEGRMGKWFLKQYRRLAGGLIDHPRLLLPIIFILIGAGWFAHHQLGSGFMPKMDEGGFILDYRAPAGTSLTETDRLLRQVETILKNTPEVETYSRRTGLQLGGGITEANEGDFFVRLKPLPRRPIEEIMDDVRERVETTVPGLDIELLQLMEDLIGDLTAVPQPVEIKMFSDDGKILRTVAPKVADAIAQVKGVVDINDGIVLAGDALIVHVDRDKAALEGIDPEEVTRIISGYLNGIVTTQVQQTPKMIGVRVWSPEEARSTADLIATLRIKTPDGHVLPLSRIAKLEEVTGQPQIVHEDLKRMVAVTARISGRDMGSVISDIKQALSRPGLIPKGMYYELGGLYRQQQIAFKGMMQVFIAAVLLVFLLLLFLYEKFRVAYSVMATTLLSLSAVFIGLFLTHIEINISSMMGLTMIIGIVTETAIFYISEYKMMPEGLSQKEALILSGEKRIRPVAMTTMAAILALMPLAVGSGQGSAMLQPLAVSIVSGLCIQLPLVLMVLPVFLSLFKSRRNDNDGQSFPPEK